MVWHTDRYRNNLGLPQGLSNNGGVIIIGKQLTGSTVKVTEVTIIEDGGYLYVWSFADAGEIAPYFYDGVYQGVAIVTTKKGEVKVPPAWKDVMPVTSMIYSLS